MFTFSFIACAGIFFSVFSHNAQAVACPLTVNTAYKTATSPAVYYVDADCRKRPFKSAVVYKSYFSSWNDVRTTTNILLSQVPDHALGFMPLGPRYNPKYGALVKIVTDPKVYFLLNDKKYWISSEPVFKALRYKWEWIEDVDRQLLDKYPDGGEIFDVEKHRDGTVVKYASSPQVYILESGQKRPIASEQEFNNLGYRWDRIVVISENEVYPTVPETPVTTPPVSSGQRTRLSKDDFTYLGAFRMPQTGAEASRFGYGGGAFALNPHGDPNGPNDGFPGSLYVLGHAHDQLLAEISIPAPKDQRNSSMTSLNAATLLHDFVDITEGYAKQTDEGNGYRIDGLAYLDAHGSQSTGKIYWTARTYYNVDTSDDLTHGMSNADLSNVAARGMWRLGNFHGMLTGGYIFPVPKYFADTYLGGKRLISGLFTQQGVSGTSQGPAMFAFGPWLDNPSDFGPANSTKLAAQALVYYPYRFQNGVETSNFPDYQIPDGWEAGAWISTAQKHAVVIVGTRAMGATYYGDARPGDCNIYKGYHGDPYEPRIIFYDPAELALATQGQKDSTTIVPYLEWNPSEFFVSTCEWNLTGVAYDEENRLLYVLHSDADTTGEPTPLVYVFRVKE